jgi:hypothetical protein
MSSPSRKFLRESWVDRPVITFVLDSIAQTLSYQGDPTCGVTLMGAAASIREPANARLTANE